MLKNETEELKQRMYDFMDQVGIRFDLEEIDEDFEDQDPEAEFN